MLADYPALAALRMTGSISRRSTSSRLRSSGTGCLPTCHYEVADDINFSAKGDLEPAQVEKPGRAAVRSVIGPAAGNTTVLDTIRSIHATNPFNPFGVTLDCRRTVDLRAS